jgi:diamine N-acetyltransferase
MIRGEHTYLRPCEPGDIEMMYDWEGSDEARDTSGMVMVFSRKSIRDYVNSVQDITVHRQLRLIICRQTDRMPVGMIDFFDFDPIHRRVCLGIFIADLTNRRKGYARDAISAALGYAFKTLGVHQVHCSVREDNFASIALFESLGFDRCGLRKDWYFHPEGMKSEILMQLLSSK